MLVASYMCAHDIHDINSANSILYHMMGIAIHEFRKSYYLQKLLNFTCIPLKCLDYPTEYKPITVLVSQTTKI